MREGESEGKGKVREGVSEGRGGDGQCEVRFVMYLCSEAVGL